MSAPATFALQLTRFIRAPREKVFDAFLTEQAIKAWMCPRGLSIPRASVDARPGGNYRVVMQARTGECYTVAGVYRRIERPSTLEFTWKWEGGPMPAVETNVIVTFVGKDGGTELTMRHSGFPDAGMCDSHRDGWGSTLTRLTDLADDRGVAASVTVIGDARSTYVRSVRMALIEKQVAYTLQSARPHSPEVLAINPFGRIPAFRDGDLELFETTAILRYVDESFAGPSLLPWTIRARARCEQWVSTINSYVYDAMIRRYVLKYLFPRSAGGTPDQATIDQAMVDIRAQLAILERAYRDVDYLVGGAPSIADLLLAPILGYVEQMPEGAAVLVPYANVRRAQAVIRARACFQQTNP